MKKLLFALTVVLTVISNDLQAQWSNHQFQHGGITRQYRVYLPVIYNASNPASVVLTLHGMGDNMTNFSGIGMNLIADTANIIVVVPQAINDPIAGTSWNSRAGYMGYFPNSTVDDIGFIDALIDTIKFNYSVNSQKVYACGFSMGGFMTQRLACESTGSFAALASVSGTIGNGISTCNPDNPIPVAHFHGTADQTIPYSNNTYGIDVDSLINFWIANNNLGSTAQTYSFPDIMSDGYTVDHFKYDNGTQNSRVELFKVNGADHVWLDNSNDIVYSKEIWKFFRQFENTTNLDETAEEGLVDIYPNPAESVLYIKSSKICSFDLVNALGQSVHQGSIISQSAIDLSEVEKGIYVIKIHFEDGKVITRSVVVN